jgi:predicted nucleic acid-binding protein
MRVLIDTSAWIKYFIAETGTEHMQTFLTEQITDNGFYAAAVTYAEMHATFTRAWKGGRLTEDELAALRAAFDEQWKSINFIEADESIILLSGELAKIHALRGCDAFQLASALRIQARLFISSDDELNEAAKQCGLLVWNPVCGEYFADGEKQDSA